MRTAAIHDGIRDVEQVGPHRVVMGNAYDRLAPQLKVIHDLDGRPMREGSADVIGAANPIAGLIARIMRFPRAGTGVHVVLDVKRRGNLQRWTRTFAGQAFESVLTPGRLGTWQSGLLVETFGPLSFGLEVTEVERGLVLRPKDWSAFGLRMPRFLMPWSTANEWADGDRFHFSVDIGLPFIGRLVRYEGHLVVEEFSPRAVA